MNKEVGEAIQKAYNEIVIIFANSKDESECKSTLVEYFVGKDEKLGLVESYCFIDKTMVYYDVIKKQCQKRLDK